MNYSKLAEIHLKLTEAEEQLDLAETLACRTYWSNQCDQLEAAYMDEASKHASEAERNIVAQVLTINYNQPSY